MNEYSKFNGIKALAEPERPREKMLNLSKSALTDAELIAILIGSGTKNQNAVDLAREILSSVNNSLIELAKLTINDLMKFNGIGYAKAITIVSALELGNRKRGAEAVNKAKITASRDAFEYFHSKVADLVHEAFWILTLNRANKIIRSYQVSEGGIGGTVVDSRIVFKHAIEDQASGLILCHNHPSGNIKPSEQDKQITRKLSQAGAFLEIPILDHLIIGENSYFSFADEGIL